MALAPTLNVPARRGATPVVNGHVESPPLPAEVPPLRFENLSVLLRVSAALIGAYRLEEAEALLLELRERAPTNPSVLVNLSSLRERLGRQAEAIEMARQAVELCPQSTLLVSNLIFAMDRDPNVTLADAQAIRAHYNSLVHRPPQPFPNTRDPERRLRVGYVSHDLAHHSAAFSFGAVLFSHSTDEFDFYAYAGRAESDEVTERFKEKIPNWRRTTYWSDDELEAAIRADEIDILVDLGGHAGGNRLPVFGRKPAPVQITAWGYITGTGVENIDYMVCDRHTVPESEGAYYVESKIRLPSILSYLPLDASLVGEVQPSPCEANGSLTFGVFQRLAKLQPQCIRVWSEILQAVPDARLVIKALELDDLGCRVRLEAAFRDAGAPLDRLQFRGKSVHPEHLQTYNLIDVNLDPWPDGGGISTLDAAWMGVPTLTLPWRQISSRVGTSVNRELGLPSLIAESPDDYLRRAIALNEQREALAAVRRRLRDVLMMSAYGDHSAYCASTERAYREAWRAWVQKEKEAA